MIVSFARRVAADLTTQPQRRWELDRHLREAEAWLERAHDATPDGGVSYGWSLRGGWWPSYRETSGYIATTFFNLADFRAQPAYRERALRIARWLLEVQNADGSFSNPRYGPSGIVFDTGQDLFGLVRAFRETEDELFLKAAQRAGAWLVSIAGPDGRWTRSEHMGVPHVYNSRTAWALLQLDAIAPHEGQQRIARANLDWALSQQRGGYFDNCAFSPGKAPYTHTIAYAIRGLLESGRLLREPRYLEAAEVAARALLDHVRDDGFIPGQIDTAGKAQARYCCLTGNCQLAIIWAKLFDGGGGGDPGTGGGDVRFQRAATLALDYVMGCQDVDTRDANVRGAIKGSHPIWGRYAPFSYPNWATKFFVDALMLRSKWKI